MTDNFKTPETYQHLDLPQLANDIKSWARASGFQHVGITDTDLSQAESHLANWLQQDFHGEMHYMQQHGYKRSRPSELQPGTLRIISVTMNYWPENTVDLHTLLQQPNQAYVSRYALGRDYHKVIRKRLQSLADQITAQVGEFGYRVFTDSAPVLEKALAEKAGLGWIGKHTNLISEQAGSWFFIGEIYTDLPLPVDQPANNHCGTCSACLGACPTQAIVAPYQVDARRCISYLTIELRGTIPVEFRPLIGNRIYGCDDCQLVCPWNRFASVSHEPDFSPRHQLDSIGLLELFSWSEKQFLENTAGSAIRRIGYECWQRNIAIALGNAPSSQQIIRELREKLTISSAMVREHIQWALQQQSRC